MVNSTQYHDIYIALFARTSTLCTYHWALLSCASNLCPTATAGIRYHVTNSIQIPAPNSPNLPSQNRDGGIPWRFEAEPLADLFTASPLLARVRISRIADPALVLAALKAVPLIQEDKSWTCRVWVRDGLAALAKHHIIDLPSHLPDPTTVSITNRRLSLSDSAWTAIESACVSYLENKHAIYRWRDASEGRWVEGEVPTWDLQDRKEIVS